MKTTIHELKPKTPQTATPAAAALLAEAKASLGFIPNMYATMANSPAALATYAFGYSQFRSQTSFTAAEQEIVFLTISRDNQCEYCVAAHSMIAERMSEVTPQTLAALRQSGFIENDRDRELSNFTSQLLETRGRPSVEAVQRFLEAGFAMEQVLDLVLAIAVKTISNYSNHLTHPVLDGVFAGHSWQANQ